MPSRVRHMINVRAPVLAAYATTVAIVLVATIAGWFEIRSYDPLTPAGPVFREVPWPVVSFLVAWVAVTISVLTVWMWKLR